MNLHRQSCIVVLIAAGLLGACDKPAPVEKGPRLVVVENPQTLSGPAGAESFPGTLRARNEADLSFRVPGKISRRLVELGSRVKRGDVIAELDPDDAQLNLSAARAALAAAESDVTLARNEEQRYRDLKAKGHVGQSAVDLRTNTLLAAQAREKQARSQLSLAQNQSAYTKLRADRDGVITQVYAEVGNVVAAGQPVVHFAADGEREVQISVPEGRVEALKSAGQLLIEIYSQPGKPYPAKIRDITPQADRTTRTHEARITLMDPDADIALGATASVLALGNSNDQMFKLPGTALGAVDDNQAVVWRVTQEGLAQPVPVTVVQYLEEAVIVAGGISGSDQLVTAGVNLLRKDMPVRPIDRSKPVAL